MLLILPLFQYYIATFTISYRCRTIEGNTSSGYANPKKRQYY